MTPEKVAFYESLKDAAIEQQIKYGVPASVTLAQAWIEHGKYSETTHNYFGIHDDDGWWKRHGGEVQMLYDNGRLAPFRVYQSPEQGLEDHSRFFFRQNSRYSAAHSISPIDPQYGEKWATVICRAGYAERPKDDPDRYARNLIREMKDYDLKKYDQQAVALAAQRGQQIGYMRGSSIASVPSGTMAVTSQAGQRYGMPLRESDRLVLTSDFGHRDISYGSTNHTAIDLHAVKGTAVYATEADGIVVSKGYQASSNGKAGGGNYVYVAYPRSDGSYVVTGYLHLDQADVKIGDKVSLDTPIGKSGNTGGVAAHLDFRVCTVTGDAANKLREQIANGRANFSPRASGTFIDPKQYLAEIAVKGGLSTTLVRQNGSGQDMLAQYKAGVQTDSDMNQKPEIQQPQAPQHDMAQSQQQQVTTPSGLATMLWGDKAKEMGDLASMGGSGDLIADLIALLFSGALAAAALHNRTTTEEIQKGIDEQKDVQKTEVSAVIDRTLVAQAKAEGVDPKEARTLVEMNAEAGLAELEQERQQQRNMSLS